MSKLVRLFAVLAVSVGLFFAAPVVAQADTQGYVSKAEFRRVSKGMKMAKVRRIFDTAGRQTAYYDGYKCGTRWGWCPEQSREYRTRSRWGFVDVNFVKRRGVWRLSSKHAYWG